ncbi:hypothetical protein [Rodentibacter rarus]
MIKIIILVVLLLLVSFPAYC